MKAVQQNGLALQYVKNKTIDICLAAVKQNKYSLMYVTEEFYHECDIYLENN